MKRIGKLTAALLCLALLLAGAGCSGADTTWAYEADGQRMPAGVYINYVFDAYKDAYSAYYNEYEGTPEEAFTQKQILAATVEGEPTNSWIASRVRAMVLRHYGAEAKAAELGLTLDQLEVESVRSTMEAIWAGTIDPQYLYIYGFNTADFYEKNGIAQSSLEQYYLNQSLRALLFEELYSEGGEFGVSDDTLRQELNDRYAKADRITFNKVTDDEEGALDLDIENAGIKAQAEQYLQRLKDGEAIEQLEYERLLAEAEEGEKPEMPAQGSLGYVVTKPEEPTEDALTNGILNATVGEAVLVESDSAYYLLVRRDLLTDQEELENRRLTLLSEMKFEEYEEKLEQWGAAAAPTANDAAIAKYTASALKDV